MRVRQGRVSKGIAPFKERYLKKFGLTDCSDIHQPVVFFGMYDDSDYVAFGRFKNKIIVVWCGTDTLMINQNRVNILRSKPAFHIVKSKFTSVDLWNIHLPHRILPISWQSFDLDPVPRGNCIFHYGRGKPYGEELLQEIETRTGLELIKTDRTTFTKEELIKVYEKCFVGLRLTKHDGLPNTVLELGMMGRRCIYNGGLPNAIPWNNVNSIVNSVLQEYENRNLPDLWNISYAVKEFIDIDDSWLNV